MGTTGRRGVLLASSELEAGLLLNILQSTRQSPKTEFYSPKYQCCHWEIQECVRISFLNQAILTQLYIFLIIVSNTGVKILVLSCWGCSMTCVIIDFKLYQYKNFVVRVCVCARASVCKLVLGSIMQIIPKPHPLFLFSHSVVSNTLKLNKRDDNKQPWCTPFPQSEPVCCSISSSNCCCLTCTQVSQEASKMIWYSHLLKNFPQFVVMHTVQALA